MASGRSAVVVPLQPSEEQTQIALVKWFELQHPAAAPWLHHSPGGGLRNKVVAGKMKAMGTRRGFPDLTLWVRRGGFHGLAVELKAGKGRPTPEQLAWLDQMSECGWCAALCTGFDAARDTLNAYMRSEART